MSATAAGTRRQRLQQLLAWGGLAASLVTLVIALPALLDQGGGAGTVSGEVLLLAWTPLVLVIVCALTRTFGPRSIIGATLGGFFGTVSLATLVGRPIVDRFGVDNAFAVAFWVPLTEELLKLLPVALLVLMVHRRPGARPSTGDVVLFAAAVGLGFTIHENALYGRTIDGGWFAHLPFSLVVPSLSTATNGTQSMLVGGHLVYTALAGLGLSITVLYRKQHRLAVFAFPVAFGVVLLEHCTLNAIGLSADGAALPAWAQFGQAVTLGGHLAVTLLLVGVAALTWHESKVVQSAARDSGGLLRTWKSHVLRPAGADIARRATALAGNGTTPITTEAF